MNIVGTTSGKFLAFYYFANKRNKYTVFNLNVMLNKRLLLLSGYVFLVWGILDVILKVSTYGFTELSFLWFCSVTLFVLAFGIILNSPVLLNSFLSMALLVQPFWVLDYIWISFFDVPLNGLSLFVFQPGFQLLWFIDNFRHMLMIPIGFYAVFMFSRENKKSYLFIPLFIILLLGISYTLTPKYPNINCVNESCISAIDSLSGFPYFVVFLIITIVITLLINFAINSTLRKIDKARKRQPYGQIILSIFIVLMLISIASIVAASLKYSKIPKYSCIETDNCDGCAVNLECKYIYGEGNNQNLMYTIENGGNNDYVCDIHMRIYPSEDYEKIATNSWIRSNEKYKVAHELKYPDMDSTIKLKSDCVIYKAPT